MPAREVEVAITSVAAGGDGVGRADGVVVFTPRTAPGDLALVRAVPVRSGRLARGTLLGLLRPSPVRAEPPCTHFTRDRCGGCQLQHVRYESQLEAKAAIVRDALTRIGHRQVGALVVRPSPTLWRYRRKLTLALRRSASGESVGGLHRFDAPDEVFELEDCPITDERVVEVWRAARRVIALLPEGPALRIAIRATEGGFACVVEGGHRWPDPSRFATAVPELTEIWWAPTDRPRRRVSRASGALAPPDAGTPQPAATGASFVQVNAGTSSALHAAVVDHALRYAPATVADGYAGTGATAVALARRGVRVTAIEADAEAATYCASQLPPGSRALAARVEDVPAAVLGADVVILNPPRQGLAEAVTSRLASSTSAGATPRAIIYVSCDAATLARDLARLPRWRIRAVECFDMFPQTAHVETLCELIPDAEEGA